jgi:exopolyphosphatase/guanosine-5'-triphosphate,3'-diphosphate pyrophosphatase
VAGGDAPLVVFDTGGGSTQFTFGRGGQVDERFSLEVGAVRYTERFGLAGVVTSEVLGEAMEAISADLSRIDGRPAPENDIRNLALLRRSAAAARRAAGGRATTGVSRR